MNENSIWFSRKSYEFKNALYCTYSHMPAIKYDSRFFREHPRIIKHLHQLCLFTYLKPILLSPDPRAVALFR